VTGDGESVDFPAPMDVLDSDRVAPKPPKAGRRHSRT